jgi:hypothetical protein
MLRGQLGNVTDDKWWDTTSPADIAATVDLAERYADVSPYAHATLTNLASEAERRGIDLDAGRGPGEQELGEDDPSCPPPPTPRTTSVRMPRRWGATGRIDRQSTSRSCWTT